jgi:hypothetical protein
VAAPLRLMADFGRYGTLKDVQSQRDSEAVPLYEPV